MWLHVCLTRRCRALSAYVWRRLMDRVMWVWFVNRKRVFVWHGKSLFCVWNCEMNFWSWLKIIELFYLTLSLVLGSRRRRWCYAVFWNRTRLGMRHRLLWQVRGHVALRQRWRRYRRLGASGSRRAGTSLWAIVYRDPPWSKALSACRSFLACTLRRWNLPSSAIQSAWSRRRTWVELFVGLR